MMKRFFFFYWLPIFAYAFSLQPQLGHTADITALAYSPDGKYLASASLDQTVRLWDVSAKRELRSFAGHTGRVFALAYSPDGKYLASSGQDKTIRIWDTSTGEAVGVYKGHGESVWTVAFSPDGKHFASGGGLFSLDDLAALSRDGGSDTTVKIWSLSGGSPIVLKGHKNSVFSLAYSPDGKQILSGDALGILNIWDTSSGQLLRSVKSDDRPKNNSVTSVAYSPDGKYFAAGTGNRFTGKGTLLIWDAASGAQVCALPEQKSWVSSLSYRPDGKEIAFTRRNIVSSGGRTDAIFLVDPARCAESGDLPGSSGLLHRAVYSPDQKSLAVIHQTKNEIALFDLSLKQEVAILRGYIQKIVMASYSPDGKQIIATADDLSMRLWDASSLKQVSAFEQLPQDSEEKLSREMSYLFYRSVLYRPAGDFGVWPTQTGLKVKNVKNGAERVVPQPALAPVSSPGFVAVSPKGDRLYFSDARGAGTEELMLLDATSGVQLATQKFDHRVVYDSHIRALAVSPNGSYVAVGVGKGRWGGRASKRFYVQLLDAGTLKPLQSLRAQIGADISSIAFSQNESLLLAGSRDQKAYLFNTATGALVYKLSSEQEITAVALSKDGVYSATASQNKLITLWDNATQKPIKTFVGHTDRVTSLSFHPDSQLLLSTSDDGTLRLWKLSDGASLAMATSRENDWVVYDEKGYFDCSPRGTDLVSITEEMGAFGVDQFAIQNNRPDLLLEKMNLGTPEEKAYFKLKYERRVKRAGLDPKELEVSFLDLPKSTIVDAKAAEKDAELTFRVEDTRGLRFYQIYINGVPLYANLGKELQGTWQKITEKVPLRPGTNRIEVSALNLKGQESLRASVVLAPTSRLSGRLFFVGFGVSDYEDPSIPDLSFAHKDVQDLANAFSKLTGYTSFSQKLYTNKDVSLASLKSAKEFLKTTQPQDTVVLFIAGHGLHDQDAEATYYYLGHSAKLSNLSATAISFEMIEDLLAGIPAQQKLFLMDTCESGEVEEETELQYSENAKKASLGARAIVLSKTSAKSASSPKKRTWVLERDRFIYQDLSRRTGAVVFSSSQGKEFSYESTPKQNGLFTAALVEALSGKADANTDKTISLEELQKSVSAQVAEWSTVDGVSLQHPTIDRDNPYARLGFSLPGATP